MLLSKCILLFLGSFLSCALLYPPFIALLERRRVGQSILEIGPSWHKPKEGTPTMGGAVFLIIIPLFAILGEAWLSGTISPALLFLLLFAVSNGLIGVLDDATKLKNKQNQGLLPWQKLFLQSVFTFIFLYLFFRFSHEASALILPFTHKTIDWHLPLLFVFFLAVCGILNSVNLSDGIDGLCASSLFVISLFFLLTGALSEKASLLALGTALCGAMAGFLLYNRHPAKIFMGDTGSLFLGALTAGAAFLTESPATLLIYNFLFLLEGGSVILQVLFFKRTGKRLFRMAPLHHHFEKSGWSENRIVLVFSFITLLSCLFAYFAFL